MLIKRIELLVTQGKCDKVKNDKGFLTGGKARQYPYFVRLSHSSTPLRSVEQGKEWQRVHDGGKVRQYPYFVGLFHTSTPLRSVELSKEWQRVHDWGKVRQYPYFVRLFHTSAPLRSVELSKEWQGVLNRGKSATISLLCQTFAHFHTSEKCGTR